MSQLLITLHSPNTLLNFPAIKIQYRQKALGASHGQRVARLPELEQPLQVLVQRPLYIHSTTSSPGQTADTIGTELKTNRNRKRCWLVQMTPGFNALGHTGGYTLPWHRDVVPLPWLLSRPPPRLWTCSGTQLHASLGYRWRDRILFICF